MPDSLVLVGGSVVVGDGTPPLQDAVVVADERGVISYVGREPPAEVTRTARRIDVSGCTLLPGFFDCHIHFHLDGLWGMQRRADEYPPLHVFETAQRMRATLDAGVTSARDLGGTGAGFRVAQERGLLAGPRLQVAVRLLSHTGGHADMTCRSGIDLVRLAGEGHEICDTPDEARVSVRRVLRDGADVIKICATGGITTLADQPDDEGLSDAEIAAVVDESQRHRCPPVAAHAQGAAGIRNAIRAGVTSVEHGYLIDEEGIDLALERGTFLVPTLSAFGALDRAGSMSAESRAVAERLEDRTKARIAAAIERGVAIAVGTDAPAGRFGGNLDELRRLVELGMSPMDAIVAGTSASARLCGVDDKLGALEQGKYADIAVCAGDPLSDISLLSDPDNVRVVIQGGVVVKGTPAGGASR
ncbi:MAG: amidohydrolase family protein [Jatrophihabitantaceae bacterium]